MARKFHGVWVLAGQSQPPNPRGSHGWKPQVVAALETTRPESRSTGAETSYVEALRPFRFACHTDARAIGPMVLPVSELSRCIVALSPKAAARVRVCSGLAGASSATQKKKRNIHRTDAGGGAFSISPSWK